jgi:hypothetical protein
MMSADFEMLGGEFCGHLEDNESGDIMKAPTEAGRE